MAALASAVFGVDYRCSASWRFSATLAAARALSASASFCAALRCASALSCCAWPSRYRSSRPATAPITSLALPFAPSTTPLMASSGPLFFSVIASFLPVRTCGDAGVPTWSLSANIKWYRSLRSDGVEHIDRGGAQHPLRELRFQFVESLLLRVAAVLGTGQVDELVGDEA